MSKKVKFFRAKVRSLDVEKHTAEVVVSDQTVDRYKEIVGASAMKKAKKAFMEHPVLLSSHAYRGLMSQIGKWLSIKVDLETGESIAKGQWFVGEGNPEADWGWKLAEKGIAAFSIGFIPKQFKEFTDEEREKNGGAYGIYEDLELLEISQVLVPANPSALQKSFDEAEDPVEKDFYKEVLGIAQQHQKDLDAASSAFHEELRERELKKEGKEIPSEQSDEEVTEPMLKEIKELLVELKQLVEEQKKGTVLEAVKAEPINITINAVDPEKLLQYFKENNLAIAEAVLKATEPEKKKEEPAPDPEKKDAEEADTATPPLSEEKVEQIEKSIREALKPADNTAALASIKGLFDEITEEMSKKLSVQPKGQ